MKVFWTLIICCGLILSSGCSPSDNLPTPFSATNVIPSPSPSPILPVSVLISVGAVGMGANAFGVNPLVVVPGTEVIWTNGDTVEHTVTDLSGNFDSGYLEPGDTFSYTYNTPGSFEYEDAIYGSASMRGTVLVQDPNALLDNQ
jgi:plastocyanin